MHYMIRDVNLKTRKKEIQSIEILFMFMRTESFT